ncbi:hypothetical protein AB0K60_22890 [Thermopolyspora sp. NPDC052614]|uniref:hypothetical protein n=1 Tax=Thermopolyspora sp. NPDC052614 TaxID=3155682 RepID=UPI003413EB32
MGEQSGQIGGFGVRPPAEPRLPPGGRASAAAHGPYDQVTVGARGPYPPSFEPPPRSREGFAPFERTVASPGLVEPNGAIVEPRGPYDPPDFAREPYPPPPYPPPPEPPAPDKPGGAPPRPARGGSRSRSRAWPAVVVSAVLALLCAVVAGIAASTAGAEMTRGPDAAEIQRATADEIARRWQVWPADRIFPPTLSYVTEQGGSERARRVGVSSRTECAAAVDARLRAPLRAAHCRAVLRATYLDALQGVVVTIGVAAFPDSASAAAAYAAFPRAGRPSPGLRALAFPGTVTDRFTAAGRQHGYARQAGPYVVAVTAGQVDGRPARAVGRQRATLFAFTTDLADGVLRTLVTPARLDCAAEEWLC